MKKKKLLRRIILIIIIAGIVSTPFWIDFQNARARLVKLLGGQIPESEEVLEEKVVPQAKPTKAELLPKVTAYLRSEGDLTPKGEAEIIGIIDLNDNGQWEIIANTEAGGAYTSLFAILQYQGGRVSYVNLVDREGQKKKASFVDGSSVRHANAFKIFNNRENKAYVQLSGEADSTGEKWTWDIAAYSWNGKAFSYNKALSEKIVNEDPQKVFMEEDYLNELFRGN